MKWQGVQDARSGNQNYVDQACEIRMILQNSFSKKYSKKTKGEDEIYIVVSLFTISHPLPKLGSGIGETSLLLLLQTGSKKIYQRTTALLFREDVIPSL